MTVQSADEVTPHARPEIRVVPGVGQFTVPDEHAELVELLYQATRDATAISILSDWLRDRDDERADLVGDLAAQGVIPDFIPPEGDEIPLAAGREWCAVRRANGVRGRVYPGTRLAAAIRATTGRDDVGGRDISPYRFAYRISADHQDQSKICSALDCCRGRFLFPLFGSTRTSTIALRSLRGTCGAEKIVRLLVGSVTPAVGARWLLELRGNNPARFQSLTRHRFMRFVLERPEYAKIGAEVAGSSAG
jgi:hypothetical protein